MTNLILALGALFVVSSVLIIMGGMFLNYMKYRDDLRALKKYCSKDVCMCGDYMDAHHWGNHVPVSQYDHYASKVVLTFG